MWDWNIVTNAVYVDPSLKDLLGFADHEIADHADDWRARVPPDDWERLQATAYAHMAEGSAAFEAPLRMLHRDGSSRYFHVARGSRRARGRTSRPA